MAKSHRNKREKNYRNHILVNVIVVEILLIGLFRFWPTYKTSPDIPSFSTAEHPLILADVTITRQGGTPPMPPMPSVPVVVPNNTVIQDPIPELNMNNILDLKGLPGNTGLGGEGGGPPSIVSNPQKPPSVVKIVEPAVPSAAKKANIKVEIVVNFLVDADGKVDKATITQIKLYNNDLKEYKIVKSIGYGIPKATIDAAMQWRFRPAQQDGKSVRAYTKHIFTFGI